MINCDELYGWVKDLPIVDWHNYLDLGMIAADKPLGTLYEVWVKTDPYKHRAMRICGVPERRILGSRFRMNAGAFSDDEVLLRPMLENICYRNAEEMVK